MLNESGILDTIGIEFETDQIFRTILTNKLTELATIRRPAILSRFTLHNDASAQVPIYITNNNYFTLFRDRGLYLSNIFKTRDNSGVEFVTNPIQFDELCETVVVLTDALRLCGEYETSSRSSIHVHVGFYPRKNWIYNMLLLGLFSEALLFRISGLGYQFRGDLNNSIYCRPLMNPPVIKFKDGNFYRMFDAVEFAKNLRKKTMEDFWSMFLSSGSTATLGNYPPGRYLSINFLSLLIRKTIEFRTANISLNPTYIQAYVRLCQVITELAVHTKEDELKVLLDNLVDVTEEYSDTDIFNILYRLNEMSEIHNTEAKLSKEHVDTIVKLINITPKPSIIKDILSHRVEQGYIASTEHLLNDVKRPVPDTVVRSGFIDIHNSGIRELEFNRIVGGMSA